MELELRAAGGELLARLEPDDALLGAFPVSDGCGLHVGPQLSPMCPHCVPNCPHCVPNVSPRPLPSVLRRLLTPHCTPGVPNGGPQTPSPHPRCPLGSPMSPCCPQRPPAVPVCPHRGSSHPIPPSPHPHCSPNVPSGSPHPISMSPNVPSGSPHPFPIAPGWLQCPQSIPNVLSVLLVSPNVPTASLLSPLCPRYPQMSPNCPQLSPQVIDRSGGRMGQFEDVSQVPKYEMADSDYDKRTGDKWPPRVTPHPLPVSSPSVPHCPQLSLNVPIYPSLSPPSVPPCPPLLPGVLKYPQLSPIVPSKRPPVSPIARSCP